MLGDYRRGTGGEAGRREGEEWSRSNERHRDSEGGQKKGSGGGMGGNAWAKGMPRSLGGPDKPIILKRKKVEEEVPVSKRCVCVGLALVPVSSVLLC